MYYELPDACVPDESNPPVETWLALLVWLVVG